jgi:hypothetical protein
MNEGTAILILDDMGNESINNREIAKNLYKKCISILDNLGDGYSYSLALLKLNYLLKENFYKTGDKKYLEECENELGGIEEKIKNRSIVYENSIREKIHQTRAGLFELKGSGAGILKASREYNKAFELSNDHFYEFMDEFCQTRIINPPNFCNLVLHWKGVEKEGIFLDHYDYAVFECHLENAVTSAINNNKLNEKKELNFALDMLKEIKSRTYVKVIIDKVSAHINLLQAVTDCFTENLYEEAAKDIEKSYDIFSSCGDEQGEHMCEIFYNAVVRNRDPNAWYEIIRNREFSSNFYYLLCELSDRKRAKLESDRFDQIPIIVNKIDEVKNDMKDIKEKINYVFVYLRPGIKEEVEISVGAEYLGTGAKHVITISLQDISYSDLKEDIERITVKGKLSKMPERLVNKIKDYLLRHGDKDILEKLT